MLKHGITALAVTAALASGVRAQEPARPDSVIRTAPITVTAVRPVTTVGGASALTASMDSLDAGAAPTMEQALREMPLVTVRTNSRGEAQFSLRGSGSDARQVAVLLDGIPLNLGWDDRADLSVLPATAATALTLVRGLPSVLYGPNVLGGVVEVDVAHGPRGTVSRAAADVRLGLEHTGTMALAVVGAAPVRMNSGRLSVRGGAGLRDRRGYTLPGSDDLRTNTDLHHVDGFLAARYADDGGAWLTFASSAFRARRGVAPEMHSESPRFWRYPHTSRFVTAVTGGTGDRASPFGGRGDMEASIGVDMGRTEILSYASSQYEDVVDTEDADDRTVTLRLLADQTVGSSVDLRSAFTLADIRHDEVLGGTESHAYRQRLWSGAVETVWRAATPLASLPLVRVSIGAALDGADTPLSGDKPALDPLTAWGGRIGATAASASGVVLWHAGVSRRARVPSLRELYSGALGRFAPNPALRPEILTAAEAGATTHRGRAELQVVAFHRRLADAIEQVTLADRRRQRVNLGTARSTGAELLGSWSIGPVALNGDVTVQQVEFSGSSLRPEYQPSLAGGAGIALPLPLDVRAAADVRYVGTQYCNDPNAAGQLTLAPSGRLDMSASRTLSTRGSGLFSRMELRAAVDNLTDAAVYDQCGLPQPGRTFRIQLRAF